MLLWCALVRSSVRRGSLVAERDMFQCRQGILILHTTQEALITCHCIYVEWEGGPCKNDNKECPWWPPTEHARAYFISHWPLLVALTFKAKLHLRQSSLKYNSNRRSKQYSRMVFCKGASSLLYCQGACVLHEHNVAMHCCMCPTAQCPVEARNLILTPPCSCHWSCSREDSFYIWQECYLRLSTAAEKIHLWYLIWSPPCPQASWLYQQSKIVALQL